VKFKPEKNRIQRRTQSAYDALLSHLAIYLPTYLITSWPSRLLAYLSLPLWVKDWFISTNKRKICAFISLVSQSNFKQLALKEPLMLCDSDRQVVSSLNPGSRGPRSSPGREHYVVFLGKTLYSRSASLYLPVDNPAMD